MSSPIAAIVAHEPSEPGKPRWQHEQVTLAQRQPGEHELLVRMVAAGICHTDLFVSGAPSGAFPGLTYPKIMGHEGAGYVEAVGPGVTVARKGDPVLLSYTFCRSCDLCAHDEPMYCETFDRMNSGRVEAKGMFATDDGEDAAGKFFGQSSFAALSVVDEQSVVNVRDQISSVDQLRQCAPLGCGFMTGCGASLNHVQQHEILIVAGLGAVGMGAILGARQVKCKAIIAVDRVASRLQLARECGATHIYDTTGKDPETFVSDIQALVGGQRIAKAIDTTAVVPVIQQVMLCLGKRGKMLQIGVPQLTDTLSLPMGDFFFKTKVYETHFLGDSKAQDLVPKMVEWFQQGEFPIDKMSQFYKLDQIHEALEDMKSKVIKPILVFE